MSLTNGNGNNGKNGTETPETLLDLLSDDGIKNIIGERFINLQRGREYLVDPASVTKDVKIRWKDNPDKLYSIPLEAILKDRYLSPEAEKINGYHKPVTGTYVPESQVILEARRALEATKRLSITDRLGDRRDSSTRISDKSV